MSDTRLIGKKSTKQRKLILDELSKFTSHPTAEDLYLSIKHKLPNIGLCTVYRNLENFCKQGLVIKIKGKPIRYDANVLPHNHIKCVVCGRVDDLFTEINLNTLEIEKLGYKLQNHKIEINGVCSHCDDKEN